MAEDKNNLTVYQKLTTMLGRGGTQRTNVLQNPKYSLNNNDLIVTNSREDYEQLNHYCLSYI